MAFRFLNEIGKYLPSDRLPFLSLDQEAIYAEASKTTGLEDLGDSYYQQGLAKLLASAKQDANLNLIGRMTMHDTVRNNLINRLLFIEAHKHCPDLFQPLTFPPIIVLGLPRSGTTFLHRLLAEDPRHRALSLLELSAPMSSNDSVQRRQMRKTLNNIGKFTPDLDAKHYVRGDIPEECIYLLGSTFTSLVFWMFGAVYDYLDWYMTCDRRPVFSDYHQLLQVLQNDDPTRRLVLKSTSHLGCLAELKQILPNALFIQTHRNPVVTHTSFNSTVLTLHQITSETIDVLKFAEANLALLENEVNLNLAARNDYPNGVFDVYYDALVSDPIGTVKRIYEYFGLAWSADYEQRLHQYLKANPQGKYGKHRYYSSDFGQTDTAIAKHFSDYCERFKL